MKKLLFLLLSVSLFFGFGFSYEATEKDEAVMIQLENLLTEYTYQNLSAINTWMQNLDKNKLNTDKKQWLFEEIQDLILITMLTNEDGIKGALESSEHNRREVFLHYFGDKVSFTGVSNDISSIDAHCGVVYGSEWVTIKELIFSSIGETGIPNFIKENNLSKLPLGIINNCGRVAIYSLASQINDFFSSSNIAPFDSLEELYSVGLNLSYLLSLEDLISTAHTLQNGKVSFEDIEDILDAIDDDLSSQPELWSTSDNLPLSVRNFTTDGNQISLTTNIPLYDSENYTFGMVFYSKESFNTASLQDIGDLTVEGRVNESDQSITYTFTLPRTQDAEEYYLSVSPDESDVGFPPLSYVTDELKVTLE